jgi:PTH1 family peptidyl-tRNA hydrolase
VNSVAERFAVTLRKPLFRKYRYGSAPTDTGALHLAQPLTYMNRSGEVFPALLRRSGLSRSDLIVVCDTLDLEPGTIRLKRKGSSAGHRGLASIIETLGTDVFARLYVGIGRPAEKGDVVRYVLEEPSSREEEAHAQAVRAAVQAVGTLLSEPMEDVMNAVNRQ